jgi:SOS-response transcriptional repressor LexA
MRDSFATIRYPHNAMSNSYKINTSDEISNVLGRLLRKKNMTEAMLVRETQIPRNTINRLITGSTPDPRISTLQSIANYFNITLDQLSGKTPIPEDATNITNDPKYIPLLDFENAHDWKKFITGIRPDTYSKWIVLDQSTSEAKFALTVTTDAMWPKFDEGNILLVDPSRTSKNRDFVVASICETKEIIFRQLFVENDRKILKPINPIFPQVVLSKGDTIIGVIVETRTVY